MVGFGLMRYSEVKGHLPFMKKKGGKSGAEDAEGEGGRSEQGVVFGGSEEKKGGVETVGEAGANEV